jgi:hypothetical protein
MENVNYIYVEPNSHFWTDLSQILNSIQLNPEELTPDYLRIGLANSKKNGYELKLINKPSLKYPNISWTFYGEISVDEIIKFIDSNEFDLFKLNNLLTNYRDAGYNLTNGLKMERREIYNRLDGERDYQDANWGSRRQMDGTPDEEKPVAEWVNYIEYHVSRAKERIYHLDTEGATAELRKVAALAVRAMEIHGCPERVVKLDYDPNIGGCDCTDCDCKK